MCTLSDKQGGACVPQIVEPVQRSVAAVATSFRAKTEVRVEPRPHQSWEVVAAVEVATQWLSLWGAKNEAVLARVIAEMLPQELAEGTRERQRAGPPGLGGLNMKIAIDLGH